MNIWDKLGVKPADILLPANCDTEKWSCIACDQFTSDKEYWDEMDRFVGDAPSTLRITFPEIYLGRDDESYIAGINSRMRQYLSGNVFREYKNAVIKCERTLRSGKVRTGLVMAVDLEQYDYSQGSRSLIRATEGTILHRLPPRIAIRRNAPLELPHIMILIDDADNTVIGSIKNTGSPVYDTKLAMNGGSIKGWLLSSEQQDMLARSLEHLCDRKAFIRRYSLEPDAALLMYAMGDGNHSLACAKACWEQLKPSLSDEELITHPARYALAEIVNLYDPSLEFEPIHRIIFDTDAEKLAQYLDCGDGDAQEITMLTQSGEKTIHVRKTCELAVGSLQNALDMFLEQNGGRIDYVHEESTVRRLAAQSGNAGFILPEFRKEQLFPSVSKNGALPRKTFSMGEGRDKRYYFEARRISVDK